MKSFSLIFSLLIAFSVFLCGCAATSAAENDGTPPSVEGSASDVSGETSKESGKFFFATVTDTESDFGGILVDPEDETLGGELVVHSENMPTLSKGERVKVIYDGQIALSYPGQIFGAKVIPQK